MAQDYRMVGEALRETEKAILWKTGFVDYGGVVERDVWVPKSIVRDREENGVWVPFWFVRKNALVDFCDGSR